MNLTKDSKFKLFFYVGITVISIVVVLGFSRSTTRRAAETVLVADTAKQKKQDPFAGLSVKAKSAYVYDLATKKVLFAKNEELPLPLASITKIMTAITAAENASPTTVVTISESNLQTDGDSGLKINERWTLRNLIAHTLVASSNDGAAAIATTLGASGDSFVEQMNNKAKTIGLSKTSFLNESGLDIDSYTSGAYGSAKDVAILLQYALEKYPTIVSSTKYQKLQVASEDGVILTTNNTDIIADRISGLLVGKTGYTTLAGGNLAIIFDAGLGHPIVIVALGSSWDGRFDDVTKLASAALRAAVID